MKNEHLFSIVVPIYNTKKEFFCECMESLLNQTADNYEIILIDDGSREETANLIDSYAKYEKVIIVHQKNQGIVLSRFNGIKKSKGDYILHVDSDDFISNTAIEELNNIAINKNPDVIIFKSYTCLNTKDNMIPFKHFFKDGIVTKEEAINQLLQLHVNSVTDKCAKKHLYESMLENIDSSIINGEDLQQSTYLFINSNSFYYTSKPIEYYRINEEDREYYDVTKISEVNFLIPTYNMLFVNNNNYTQYLKVYKTAASKAVLYIAFQICWLDKNSNEINNLLDRLNEQKIVSILSSIKENSNYIVNLFFNCLTKRIYSIIKLCAVLFKTTV